MSASLTTPSTTGRTSEETSLSLVCDENFGSGTFTESTAVRPSRQSSPVSATFSLRGDADRFGIAGDLARQRAAEAGEMGAAVALRDVVGEAQHVLVVAVVPPQRAFDGDAVALGLDHDRLRDQRRLVAVEIFDEGLDAALVASSPRASRPRGACRTARCVTPELRKASSRSRCSSVAKSNSIMVKVFGRRQEGHLGAALAVGVADDRQRRHRVAVAELHDVLLAVAPDRQLEPARQRVDDRDADAVQAAGDLVGVLVEFSAGVQLGHDDLGRRDAFALVDVGRDAAAVVAHRARSRRD